MGSGESTQEEEEVHTVELVFVYKKGLFSRDKGLTHKLHFSQVTEQLGAVHRVHPWTQTPSTLTHLFVDIPTRHKKIKELIAQTP